VLSTLEAVSRERYVPSVRDGAGALGLGQHDSALDWLERAYDAHDVHWVLSSGGSKMGPSSSRCPFWLISRRCGFTTPGTPGLLRKKMPGEGPRLPNKTRQIISRKKSSELAESANSRVAGKQETIQKRASGKLARLQAKPLKLALYGAAPQLFRSMLRDNRR